jgi:hypothetical protein
MEFTEGEVHAMFADMQCLEYVSSMKDDVMAQFTLKAVTSNAECKWTLDFQNTVTENWLKFHVTVPASGDHQTLDANQFTMNSEHDLHVQANGMLTFRQSKTATGEWAFPMEFTEGEVHPMFADMQCLELASHMSNDVMA